MRRERTTTALLAGLLALGGCHLEGTIPEQLGALSEIQVLSLSVNNLTGYVKGTFSGLLNIGSISLMNNQLTQAAVDAIIADIYAARDLHTYPGTKVLSLSGSNAAPSTTSIQKIGELNTNHDWNITYTAP